ncbi:MAG TPA: DnaB-like helicase N-terminal domain-containing protein, partial [Prosthecobacter sp.]|nr:DnaB-like helicase N-terminal domain-containing protein [Prosthecobacter sp.]
MAEEQLPNSPEAEKGMAGAMISDPVHIAAYVERFGATANVCHDLRTQIVCDTLAKMSEQGKPIDLITLDIQIKQDGFGKQVTTGFLAELQDSCPTPAMFDHFCEIVEEKAHLRAVIRTGSEIVAEAKQS